MATSKLFSVCIQRRSDIYTEYQSFYVQYHPHYGKKETQLLVIFLWSAKGQYSFPHFSKDWSRIQVNQSSKDCFLQEWKTGKSDRDIEECYLAPSEYPLETTDEGNEIEDRNLAQIVVLCRLCL